MKQKLYTEAEILRQKAEATLQKKPPSNVSLTEDETMKLIHELEVHQIELQMLLETTGEELSFEIREKANLAEELLLANKELAFQNEEKTKQAENLLRANKKLQQLNNENAKLAVELVLANKELLFQNEEKAKRAEELVLANVELLLQSDKKAKQGIELILDNKKLLVLNDVKAKRAAELVVANKELLFQNNEKAKRAEELVLANVELLFQNDEKAKQAVKLVLANKKLLHANNENAKLAVELVIANKELLFQNNEKNHRADELVLANKELLFQNEEKSNRADELTLANDLISQQRDRLEEIASLVPGVVYQYRLRPDGSSCFPYASDAIKQIYRVSPEEVREDAGKVFANLHPDDYDGVIASIQASAKELSPWQHEYRVKFDDGTIRSLYGNGIPQPDEDGSVLWHGFITDITEQKQIQEALKHSEVSFRNVVEVSPIPNIVHRNLVIIYANQALLKMMGVEKLEDVLGSNILDWIHPDFHQLVKLRNGKISEEDIAASLAEVQFFRLDGTVGDAEMQSTSMFYNGLPAIHSALHDISENKRNEKVLIELNARHNSMIANISDIIGIIGADGMMKYISPNVTRWFGWLPEDQEGISTFSLIHPDDIGEVAKNISKLLEHDNSSLTAEFRFRCKDGTYKPVELNAVNLMNDPVINGILLNYRDITERKHTEDVIKQNESKYSSMIANISDVIGIMSADGLMTYKSPNIEKYFGWLPEERIGTGGFETTHPDDIEKVEKAFYGILEKDNSVITLEFRYLCKDGTYKPIELTASNQLNNPAINGVLLNYRDISDRKAIEANLEESREKYRGLSEASFEAIFISESGLCIEQNLAAELMFGYTSEEALTRYGTDWIVPEDREMVMKNMLSGLQEPYEAVALRKDGSTFPCVLHGRMMQYKGKDIRVTSLNDITARKNAEDKLKLLSTHLSLATVAGGIGIWDYDIVNNAMLWDDQMYALYGIKEGNFGGVYETWRAGLHPDDAEQGDREVQMAIRGEKEFDTEFRVIWPDQSVHTIKALAITKRDESGQALNMVGTNWDITDQKNAEEALLKARDEAESANRSKSLFLANMSHEIRTPLNAIIGFSQLLNREQLTDRQSDYSVSIHRSGEHLLKLLNDILELSKIEAGYGKINAVNIDLLALLADIRMMFSQQAQSKKIQLNFETADNLPQYIVADDNKLRQILINLIGNALKFTDKGEISVRAGIDQTDELKSMLVIEIHDSGTGISEYEIGNLFRQFEQASEGIKQSNGTGLGLALSRELAILMGGNISVASQEGEGSVFTIRVEIKEGKPEAADDSISKRVIGIDHPKDSYRILVVDDREENLRVVVDFLHWVGFETRVAMNGADAIAGFEQWNPHLILMDLRMPLMDGYEATSRIKATEKGKQVPIVVLSASKLEVDETKIAGLDISGFIYKPFRENELFETIGKILGISYIYQENTVNDAASAYSNSPEAYAGDLAKLPEKLIAQMKAAVGKADFYRLIELITQFEPDYPELAKHLLVYANNFDHAYLQYILTMKELNNE